MNKYSFLILFVIITHSVSSQNWQTNFEEVKFEAQQSHKPIILVFSGSDWCAPCIKLDKQIFQSDVFKNYTNENAILIKADFPRKKQNALSEELKIHNIKLAEHYNKNGFFPYVLVLDEHGKVLGELGYEKLGPQDYLNRLISFMNK